LRSAESKFFSVLGRLLLAGRAQVAAFRGTDE